MESVMNELHIINAYIAGEHCIYRVLARFGVDSAGKINVRSLPERMDTGIGTSCAGYFTG
jgi:hypothetical protein